MQEVKQYRADDIIVEIAGGDNVASFYVSGPQCVVLTLEHEVLERLRKRIDDALASSPPPSQRCT
jgi:hypothetical protein